MSVQELINMLNGLPENFKDSTVFIDDKEIVDTYLDTEHGEFNIMTSDRVSRFK